MKFSEKRIRDWKKYEKVRVRGRYNMFDPRARRLTGLGEEAYSFSMKHYNQLRKQSEL